MSRNKMEKAENPLKSRHCINLKFMKRKNFEIVSPGISSQELSNLDMQGVKGGVICPEYNIICLEDTCSTKFITTKPCLTKDIVIN